MISAASSTAPRTKMLYGKYRGTVVNNVDPKGMGRIIAMVPDVSPLSPCSWAMPCFPWGGGLASQAGMFMVPVVGAGVWIEFEQGDQDYPIWTGCFVGSSGEVAPGAKTAMPPVPGVTIQTPFKNMIQVSDLPGPTGGIQLRTASGAMISVTDVGITISNGQGATISMLGNTVDVNGGALTVI